MLFRRNRPCFPLCLLVFPQLARLNRLLNFNNTNFIPKLLQETKRNETGRIIEISFSCSDMNPCCALAPPCCSAPIVPGRRQGGGELRLSLCCFFPKKENASRLFLQMFRMHSKYIYYSPSQRSNFLQNMVIKWRWVRVTAAPLSPFPLHKHGIT